MKIVEIINAFSLRGGAEVFLYSLLREMSKNKNNEIFLIILFDGIHESFDLKKENIKIFTCHKRKGIDFFAAKELKRILDKIKPDIVHTHLSCSASLFFAYGFKKRPWVRVHTIHSVADKESSKPIILLNKILLKKSLINFVGISRQVSLSIEKTYNTKEIVTINNGVEITDEVGSNYESRKYDFICVARFFEVKNHKFLLESFKTYLRNHNSSLFLLVGDGELKVECEKYCIENSMMKNVVFTGAVNDVGKYLAQSKVLVLTSFYEGNPISILEGISAGLVIVSSDVGGVSDVVSNNINGFLYASGDRKQFLECLEKSLTKQNWERIRKNNIVARNKFSIQACSKQYLSYFEYLLLNKK